MAPADDDRQQAPGPSEEERRETHPGTLWGGRFAAEPSAELQALSSSTHVDWRLVPYDLAGSRAHAGVLHRAGLLSDADHAELLRGLSVLGERYAAGTLAPGPEDEDVHGALERLLLAEVGEETGGRLRAGRSRNDQIATMLRWFLRDQARHLVGRSLALVDALADQAEAHLGAVMPGRTHLQHAQPVLLSHHLLAHAWPLLRDVVRDREGVGGPREALAAAPLSNTEGRFSERRSGPSSLSEGLNAST